MTPTELLKDAFTRIVESAEVVVDGLSEDELAIRPGPDANSIGWLVWHLARVQDDHVADVAGVEQVWTSQGYADRFGLPFDAAATGYGQSSEAVAQVRTSAELLTAYLRSVHDQTLTFLDKVTAEDLDRVVDSRWDPPVTLGVRLVSVVNDDSQHVGQAAYVRGLLA
ncbi:DUF664 domain-containing protein [Nocardioides panacihumi]|uniref:DUF664 domain-containing protein n=1 Tax=Nocardioides panacihumi TaxID=400774 RepID=A0ABP5BTG3_9ACTN